MSTDQGALFGPPRRTTPGDIEKAAAATIDALREAGGLDGTHALKCELIMQGARALDDEFSRQKVTVAAMQLFSKVVDIADGLPTVREAVNQAFGELVEALEAAE